MATHRRRNIALGAGAGLIAWQAARRLRAPEPLPDGPRQRLVVLGAGFGGMALLDALHERLGRQPRLEVLLLDRNNFNLFTPMLYQVTTGLVDPDNITYPLRARVRERGARFQESVVQGIDLDARCVLTDDGPVGYDLLVVALGSVTNFFGMDAVARRAFTLKTLGDGVALRNHVIDRFERADVTADPERRRELLTFNIIGAGATGVELATSLESLFEQIMLRDYPNVRREEIRIRLVEAKDRALPEMSPGVGQLATRRLAERRIQLLLNVPVVGIEGGRLRTGDERLLAPGTNIWTAGVRAHPIVAALPGDRGPGARVRVNEFLQIPGHPEVYCIGDAALVTDPETGTPVPPNAPAAIQMGRAVAASIERSLRGQPPQPFRYRFEGELLSLGRHRAIVHYRGLLFDGFPAWALWRGFYISQLMGWENRVGVLTDWAFAYLARRRESARLAFLPERVEASASEQLSVSRRGAEPAPYGATR
ncbi:MAG: NAD(P)/FAD-dependent oxidoreductase [Armatimonadetes bacterium]|nr:NAD(P)/FAD-dependent oxidoreductase [Armatimonadota bacterium]